MDPWRPGNENFPPSQINPGNPNAKQGEDDAMPPIFNVHYDLKPKDWYAEARRVNDTIELRHQLSEAVDQFYEDTANRIIQTSNIGTAVQQVWLELVRDVSHSSRE